MIIAFSKNIELLKIDFNNPNNFDKITWIDLLNPSKSEENDVEKLLNIEIPTREEMKALEISSHLYKEDNNIFMTAAMVAQSDSIDPKLDAVTFILTPTHLITIRYHEPQAFQLFKAHLKKIPAADCTAINLLIELLDATVDRLSEILEAVGHRLDEETKMIFQKEPNTKLDYQKIMQTIGVYGNLNTKTRESLVTFNRLIAFFLQTAHHRIDEEGQVRLTTLSKDITSLSDHASFVSSKINFLLDAILGMVSIEQNGIIKIFSVVAVIFLPPTLVASIYGMNFTIMPELSWKYGYLMAIGLILFAAWLPYKYFKHKKWI